MKSTQMKFTALVTEAGIKMDAGRSLPWLTNKGHVADVLAGTVPPEVLGAIGQIHQVLGGSEEALCAKRGGGDPLPNYLLDNRSWLVELDEEQHFSSERRTSFELYPDGTDLRAKSWPSRSTSPTTAMLSARKAAASPAPGSPAPHPTSGPTDRAGYACASSRIWRTGWRPSRLAVA